MSDTIVKVLPYSVDLSKPIKKTYLDTLFATEDNQAHRFDITLLRNGAALSMPSGTSVSAYLIRYSDNATVSLTGSVSGSVVSVTLSKACYTKAGQFALIIKATTGSTVSTVFYGEGAIYTSSTDTIVDQEHIIPSLSDLLAQIDAMEAATSAANTATRNANAATANANTATGKANTAANAANTAATNANTAKDAANAAAGKINNMTVSATPVSTGTATAALSTVDGHYHLALGLPKGDTGATPQISVQVATGAAGSEASVSVSGTAENPVIHLTIPRGDTGKIENLTINGKPVESGTITLTAEDVGAVTQPTGEETPGDAPAINAGTFGGMTVGQFVEMIYPVGSIYMSASATSPASLFGGTWESIGGRFLLGADATYAAGSTGGEAEHKLTVDEVPSHNHDMPNPNWTSGEYVKTWPAWAPLYTASQESTEVSCAPGSTQKTGGNQPHNNMPPYLAVYMWQRTA